MICRYKIAISTVRYYLYKRASCVFISSSIANIVYAYEESKHVHENMYLYLRVRYRDWLKFVIIWGIQNNDYFFILHRMIKDNKLCKT